MSNFIDSEVSSQDMKEFLSNYIQEQKKEKEKLSFFIKSQMFQKIITTILKKNIFLDEEHFRYFPEKVLAEFSIEDLTEESLSLFIDCMVDDELLVPQNTFVEEENPFENTTSEKLGLRVFLMWVKVAVFKFSQPLSIDEVSNENQN